MSNGGNGERSNMTMGAASQADSDYAADPASSTFFASDLKKYGDLKNMLESNKDQLRLEAMKRIIGMVAKGKDASELFPSVVKNVVSKNIEIKKLVYAYLIRYAEEQQDLALLSISTFQRALKDPNQLIRANALRVLSSIRVSVIVPIMMLAIRDSTNDMSPYVRKSAALAIPKLYSLDEEQKEQLVEVLEKLLGDRTTLVIGSAVMAFEEVCPERIDLIHKNYRRLCQILIDLEEWGQVAVLNMLTRYARMQFADPNGKETEEDGEDEFYEGEQTRTKKPTMDSDLRLLLKSAKPLLQSRNSAVVMAVIQLYYHVAPKGEMVSNVKPMIRLLRSHKEIQSVVLSNIATLAAKPSRRFLFVPHLKTFFVRSSDATHIKLQKLEILTSLASATTISVILREFQAYISTSDRELIASTIQAIGRCAMMIAEVTETCLNGLVALLSNRDDNVVGESVCVIRKLLQLQPTTHKDILKHLARLVGTITVPMAKASILWLIGEYSEQVPHVAPDVLRQVAKTFPKEDNIVKLQVLNLAAKLFTINPQQTSLLTVYVFNLAKYDTNYDIRDRGRFLRALILPIHEGDVEGKEVGVFSSAAKEILLAKKPAPVLESRFKERAELQLGTLSHYLNVRTVGYQDLPAFPAVSLPSNVRDVELPPVEVPKKGAPVKTKGTHPKTPEKFYSDGESAEEEEEEESEEEGSDEEESEDSKDSESSEDSEGSSGEENAKVNGVAKKPKKTSVVGKEAPSGSDTSSSEESSSEEEDSDEEDSSEEEEEVAKAAPKPSKQPVTAAKKDVVDVTKSGSAGSSPRNAALAKNAPAPAKTEPAKQPAPTKTEPTKPKPQNIDMLLDFDSDIPSSASVMATSAIQGTQRTQGPISAGGARTGSPAILAPARVPNRSHPLLQAGLNNGFGIAYKFPRRPFIYSTKMVAVELTFTNASEEPFENIKITKKKLPPRVEVQDFHEITILEANRTAHGTVGVDGGDTTQAITLTVQCSGREYDVTFKPRMLEMLRPIAMVREEFEKIKRTLSGLNENYSNVELPVKAQSRTGVVDVVLDAANVALVSEGAEQGAGQGEGEEGAVTVRFIGQTVSSSAAVLITVVVRPGGKGVVTVNCEKVMVGSVVLQELRETISKA